jgi:SAM-dependent methyltransferase
MAHPPGGRSLTTQQWHDWFSHQAGWTRATRHSLYGEASLHRAAALLEVGSGTGVIASELSHLTPAAVVGLDIDSSYLAFARKSCPEVRHVQADAHALPFSAGSFDLVISHYLLLWLADPGRALAEMARVVRPGGFVLACAEPDYGGRIDHPPELVRLGHLQTEALRRQGADPLIGRRLGELFTAAGLVATVGVLRGRWTLSEEPGVGFEEEWKMLGHDLASSVPPGELRRLRTLDGQALAQGRRVLFVPTFYAIGARPHG